MSNTESFLSEAKQIYKKKKEKKSIGKKDQISGFVIWPLKSKGKCAILDLELKFSYYFEK